MMNFAKKTVMITGATRGLGAQLAHCFWEMGANLILLARDNASLNSMRDQFLISSSPDQTLDIYTVDLASPRQLSELMIKPIKPVDVLINNASMQGPIGSVWENDWKEWQKTLQVNLLSPVALCRAFVPAMIEQRSGKIINLSGGGASTVRPNFSAYAVAKTGLVRFSEILAAEVQAYHIDVNCIAPGVMNTELLKEIVQAGNQNAGEHEVRQAQHSLNQQDNNLSHAVELCMFLASEQSNGITGKLISAVWDQWKELPQYIDSIKNSDVYTLRRITPPNHDNGSSGEKL